MTESAAATGVVSAKSAATSAEEQLWQEYICLLARQDSTWQMAREAWRNYVLTGLQDTVKGQVYEHCNSLCDMWRDRANAAREAWKTVAYPMNGLRLDDE